LHLHLITQLKLTKLWLPKDLWCLVKWQMLERIDRVQILFLILIWPRFNFRPNDIIDNTFVNIWYNKNRDYFNYGSNSNLFI
jgi:hypothetical protein